MTKPRSIRPLGGFGIKSKYRAISPEGTAKGVVTLTAKRRKEYEDKGWKFTRADGTNLLDY